MRGRYRTYPEYKDSQVEWLGDIPSHWEVMQLKRTVDACVNGIWGSEPNNDGEDTIVIRVADFDRARLTVNDDGYTYRRIEEKEKVNRRLKPGDLLLEKSGGGEKTLVGQVVLFDKTFEAVTSNFVAKMSPIVGFDSRYLNYVFSRFYAENINLPSIKQNTGIQNLDSGSYLAEKFGFPEADEQEKIANFLDHETAKIDTLIEKQQELIELLKEKRQAVISHVVTKGLNPDTPMRDSGVEWLGEVPAHWKTCRIKQLSHLISKGTTPSTIGGAFSDEGIRFVKAENIGKTLNVSETPAFFITEDVDELLSRSRLRENDVLVIIAGATTGLTSIASKEILPANTNQAVSFIRPLKPEYSHLIVRWLSTDFAQRIIWTGAVQAAQPNLSMEDLGNIPVVVPPADELEQIKAYIGEQISRFDETISKAQTAIGLMRERRTALISAAVTGKIDVRNWKAPSKKVAA